MPDLEKGSNKTKLQKLREHSLHFTCIPVPDHKLLKIQQALPLNFSRKVFFSLANYIYGD